MILKTKTLCALLAVLSSGCLISCSNDGESGDGVDAGAGDADTDTDSDSDGICEDCLIDSECIPNGFVNPANPCQKCDTAQSTTAWSDNDGQACDDGLYCTVNDTCSSGECAAVARECSDDIDCTGTETCDETNDTCVAGNSTCDEPESCDAITDTCVTSCTGCVISDVCYGDGQANPLGPCEMCDVEASSAAWTDKEDGSACDDDEFCNGEEDTCFEGICTPSDVSPCPDDGFFCSGTEGCDEDDDVCTQTGDPCTGDDVCVEDVDRCCIPNIAATDPACNADGDVTAFDSCGREIMVDDCPDDHGACSDGECGCEEGYGGEDCACVFFVDGEVGGPDAGTSDGTSWEQAFKTVQEGIFAAISDGCAVWVKGKPSSGLTYPEKITLVDDVAVYGGFTGDEVEFGERDIEVNKTILDGQSSGAVVTYTGDSYRANHAVIDGFTITGGSDSGMRIVDASPTVKSCIFSDNTASSGSDGADSTAGSPGGHGAPGGHGGGIYISSGSPDIIGCTFSSNGAGKGGDGGLGVNGGEGGHGYDGGPGGHGAPGGSGGGIYISSSSPNITDCTFSDNSGGEGGSGGSGGDGKIGRMELPGGKGGKGGSGGSGGHGGGIYISSGSPNITGCTFSNNGAGSGGPGGSGGKGGYGGLGMDYGGPGGDGGSGGLGGSGGHGGGIYMSSSSPDIIGCAFSSNSGGSGGDSGSGGDGGRGGDFHDSGGNGAIGGAFDDGGHGGSGGGIYISSGTPQITNCTFSNNNAGAGGHGGSGGDGGDGDTDSGDVGGWGGSGGWGGWGGHGGSGGGIFVFSGAPQITNCTFRNNSAAAGGKGGTGGSGGDGGYGSYRGGDGGWGRTGGDGGDSGRGGGIYNISSGAPQITNCTFQNNSAGAGGLGGSGGLGGDGGTGGGAGGDGWNGADGSSGSSGSSGSGGGICNEGDISSLTNCILWGNTVSGASDQIHNTGTIDVTYSDVQDGYDGEGNIEDDPLFVDAEEGNLRLEPDSPCIDRGKDSDAPLLDKDGNPRSDIASAPNCDDETSSDAGVTDGGAVDPAACSWFSDMGAYEFIPGCGNYVIEDGEECDDGNTADGDGCSADCMCEQPGGGAIPHCAAQSCAQLLVSYPGSADGNYWIQLTGYEPILVYCDMTTDGGGYTMYAVAAGIATYKASDNDSCKELGMQMVVPRTEAHWAAMITVYGASYFGTIPGIYNPSSNPGSYTNCAMNSYSTDPVHCDDWTSIDGGSWWIRGTAYTEPSGDYSAGCWLDVWGVGDGSNITFNDGYCDHGTTRYICSINDKDPN